MLAALSERVGRGDLGVRVHFDLESLGGGHDLLARQLLGSLAFECSLVPSRDGVPRVGLVMDREVLAAI